MKKLKVKIYSIIAILVSILLYLLTSNAYAATETKYINLTDNSISVNNQLISTNKIDDVYLSNNMNNGGESTEALEANVEIDNVITITQSGIYEFAGTLSNGQIAVNADNIQGEVEIVLNNAKIICENAPAIIVYSTSTEDSDCTVTIKTAANSENVITGARIKQSVEGWTDQEKLVYYVEKGYDDEQKYYERYKYDGAISSDISLTLEGEGILRLNVTGKEGIETKRNLTVNSGTYIINSLDDGINASADNESVITINGGSILVNISEEAEEGDGIDSNGYIYINGGTVYALASPTSQDNGLDADMGVYINGGYVVGTGNMSDSANNESKQAFIQLQFTKQIDENELITITDTNKNPIIAFKTDRTYTVLTISSPKLQKGESYYVYKGGEIEGISEHGLYTEINMYKEGTQQEWSNMGMGQGMQMEKPEMGQMPIEQEGTVQSGQMQTPPEMPTTNKNMNNLQTATTATEVFSLENNNSFMGVTDKGTTTTNMGMSNLNIYTKYYYILGIVAVLLILTIIIWLILKKKNINKLQEQILIMIIGILTGAIITTVGFWIYNKSNEQQILDMRGQQMMQDRVKQIN